MNKYTPRAVFYLIGLTILALGIALVIRADIGAAAWDALYVGLSIKVGLTVGSWVIIMGMTLVFVNSLLLKERPDFPAMLTLFLLGFFVDGWMYLIDWKVEIFGYKLVLFAVGMIVIAFGLAVYLQAKFAPTSIDRLMFAISARTGLSLRVSKTIGELVALVLAWLIGGPIGLGTILITFLLGPLLQFFLRYVDPVFQSITQSRQAAVSEPIVK